MMQSLQILETIPTYVTQILKHIWLDPGRIRQSKTMATRQDAAMRRPDKTKSVSPGFESCWHNTGNSLAVFNVKHTHKHKWADGQVRYADGGMPTNNDGWNYLNHIQISFSKLWGLYL